MLGVSGVVAVILLLMIVIALAGSAYTFMIAMASSTESAAASSLSSTSESMLALMNIEGTNGYKIYVRNVGQVDLSNFTAYADGAPLPITGLVVSGLSSTIISPGSVGEITINGSYLPDKNNVIMKLVSAQGAVKTKNYRYPLLAIVNDTSCLCGWTVTDCSSWWQNAMQSKGVKFVLVNSANLDSLQEMEVFDAVINPYGEYYPETSGTAVLDTIKEYVNAGGYWFESGGYSFYYSCGDSPNLYDAGSNRVCVLIDGVPSSSRSLDTSYSYMTQNGPSSIAASSRPSVGMNGICGSDQKFIGLYYNASVSRYGPALHCYGKGCIVRTDDTNQNTATVYADIINTLVAQCKLSS